MSKTNVIAEPGKHEVTLIREFDAPRELVYKACTDPKLMARWWGLNDTTTIIDKMDVQMGGLWRYIQRDAQGNEFAFRGVYHQVQAPERLVYTFEWEGMPGHILLETLTFEEKNGKTTIYDSSVFQTVADRDGMIQSGMEYGANESWNRLDEVVKELKG